MGIFDSIISRTKLAQKKIELQEREEQNLLRVKENIDNFRSMVSNSIGNNEYKAFYTLFDGSTVNEIDINNYESSEIYIFIKEKVSDDELYSENLKIIIKRTNGIIDEYKIPLLNFMHFDFADDDNEENSVKHTIIYYMEGFSIEMIVLPFGCYEVLNKLFSEKNINSEFYKDIDTMKKELIYNDNSDENDIAVS